MYLPEKDRSYVTKGEMFEDIVSSLGGRVAEQLILEDISTGASNDLQQATNIARQMITKYGFSERLGPVVYGTSQEETFLGRDFTQGKGATARAPLPRSTARCGISSMRLTRPAAAPRRSTSTSSMRWHRL